MPILFVPRPSLGRAERTYGHRFLRIHSLGRAFACGLVTLVGIGGSFAQARALNIVALGDSLTAGYQLPADAAFPAVLEKALRKRGLEVAVINAGVSGDTAAAGLERLDWSVGEGTDGVILEFGANDMLRGQDPAQTRKTLETTIQRLLARHVAVYLAGMLASPTLGPDYTRAFNAIYPALAKTYGLPLYPFFLDGVVGRAALQLSDGMHPNADGVALIVASMMPSIEAWLRSLPAPH